MKGASLPKLLLQCQRCSSQNIHAEPTYRPWDRSVELAIPIRRKFARDKTRSRGVTVDTCKTCRYRNSSKSFCRRFSSDHLLNDLRDHADRVRMRHTQFNNRRLTPCPLHGPLVCAMRATPRTRASPAIETGRENLIAPNGRLTVRFAILVWCWPWGFDFFGHDFPRRSR